jgi:hypothetical protein
MNRGVDAPVKTKRRLLMSTGVWNSATPAQRRYLLLDNGVGPFVINFLINAVIAWLLFRHATHVPMWGQSSVAGDTIATSFLLPLITCLIVTPVAHGRVRSGLLPQLTSEVPGKWLPRNLVLRSVVIGIICLIAFTPLTLLLLSVLGVARMTPWHFVYFKATFAAIEGGLVTPFLALWAISDAPRDSRPSVSPIKGAVGVSQ